MKISGNAGAVTAATTSATLATLSGDTGIESISIYPTAGDVTITWNVGEANEYASVVTEAMNGHTFVASNGSKWNELAPFRIDTACDAGWIAV